MPYGSALPEIKAVGADNATVMILPAFTFPGLSKIYVTSEDRMANSEYVIHVQTEESKLISAELSADNLNIVEDDIIDLNIKGQLENGEIIDLIDVKPIYHFDNNIIKIDGTKLYAFDEGQAQITATIAYKDVIVKTPELTLNIAKNPAEKNIESMDEIFVVANQGEALNLPKTVVAHYNTGLPRDVIVKWDDIDPARNEKMDEFTVSGSVEGTEIKAHAKIVVKGPIAVEHITMAILQNQTPELPEKLTVFYSDGSEEQVEVTWEDFSYNKVEDVGEFDVIGNVKDIDLKATAHIRVTDEIGVEQNIARAKNGYDYPKAEASFTNSDLGSND